MAYFAELDSNNVVLRVISISNNITFDNNIEKENLGIEFCQKLYGQTTKWVQSSYNGKIRGHFAGIGMLYMTNVETLGVGSTDIFIRHQPYPSWSVGIHTAEWYPPVPMPPENESTNYKWNEETQTWTKYEWNEETQTWETIQ